MNRTAWPPEQTFRRCLRCLGAISSLGMLAIGCASNDCELTRTCPAPNGSGGNGAAGATNSSSGMGGSQSSGGSGGTNANGGVNGSGGAGEHAGAGGSTSYIDASTDAHGDASDAAATCNEGREPKDEPCLVDDSHAVFVAPGAGVLGTKDSPAPTIALGLSIARAKNRKLVIICKAIYPEAVSLDSATDGVSLFGGFRCPSDGGTWIYDSTMRPSVKPSVPGPALAVRTVEKTFTIADIDFTAQPAMDLGASSIGAIIANSSGVTLHHVAITADDAARGSSGASGSRGDYGAIAGSAQAGLDCCATNPPAPKLGGSWPAASACGSLGGAGGLGTGLTSGGERGGNGLPNTDLVSLTMGNGGVGDTCNVTEDRDGDDGSDGLPGALGVAAATIGTFGSSGYVAADGSPGESGHTGQGGGGGGGCKGGQLEPGPGGGAGGMGGCGGTFGGAGKGGGASVALLSWYSSVTLDGVSLVAAKGGGGGNGGDAGGGGYGNPGGPGGSGSTGLSIAPGGRGGQGGLGGAGGSGSGGSGGPSFALVFRGTAPLLNSSVALTAGMGGAKGVGGSVDSTGKNRAPSGSDGLSALQFELL